MLGDLIYEYDAAGNRVRVGGSFARTTIPEAVLPSPMMRRISSLSRRRLVSAMMPTGTSPAMAFELCLGCAQSTRLAQWNWDCSQFSVRCLWSAYKKTVNGTTTEFLYDGLNVVQELSGGTPTANLLTGLGIDDYFLRTDANGLSNHAL